jgi:NAD(P)-dependent dehydrogenase (short-subunit alcohol dehydrogenase family)
MGQLQNKVALVTGGTSGIGRATAQRFVDEGAVVFITGRRQAELDATVQELGDNSRGIRGDVSREQDLDAVFAAIDEHGRGLDVVFANAGGGSFATLEQVTAEHFDDTFATNVRGTVFTVPSFVTGSELFADGGDEQQ